MFSKLFLMFLTLNVPTLITSCPSTIDSSSNNVIKEDLSKVSRSIESCLFKFLDMSIYTVITSTFATIICVASETGLGIVPDNALSRQFRDESGLLNQRVAALADHVYFVTAGLVSKLKP